MGESKPRTGVRRPRRTGLARFGQAVLWMATGLVPGACAPGPGAPGGQVPPALAGDREREVVCTVETLPNYLTHLTALAGLPYRSAYASRWGYTVDTEGHQILRRHAPMLQWGNGITGDLAPFFVLLPAYLPLEDEFDLSEYLRAVDLAMKRGDYRPVRDLYPDAHRRLARWLFDFEGFFASRAQVYGTYLRAVRQLAQVYERSYPAWQEEVWRQEELDLKLRADDLNGDLWTLDLLREWERRTGVRFAGSRFDVVLTAAPAGTGITGLGYERTLLSLDVPEDRQLGLIVYEVGAHLLVDLYRDPAVPAPAGDLDWATAAAYAGLVTYYTRQILPTYEVQIENDVEVFAGRYRQLADAEPGADARRLMALALAQHHGGHR